MDWSTFGARIGASGGNLREKRRQELVNQLSKDIPGLISTKTVTVYSPYSKRSFTQSFSFIYSDELNIRHVRLLPGEEIECGSLVEYSGGTWLITQVDAETEVYQKAYMERCNYVVKWQDVNGNVISKPCIIADVTKYLIGEAAKTQMVIGDSRMSMRIAKDEDTVTLKRGSRLIVDDIDAEETISYEITKPDRISQGFDGKAIYSYLLRETNIRVSDDIVENIAKEIEYVPSEPDEPNGGWL